MKVGLTWVLLRSNDCPVVRNPDLVPNRRLTHVLIHSGPELDIEWETMGESCRGPFWRVHESSVRASFGDYYDDCPPVYVCAHQIEID